MTTTIAERVTSLSPAQRELLRRELGVSEPTQRLVAYVEPNGPPPADTELVEYLEQSLPSYMIPSVFVVVKTLPRTSNGKVDRLNLPDPDKQRALSASTYEAPRTPVEQTIARVWAEALNIERVSHHDDFFALGGQSILATHTIAQLSREFGVQLRLRALFESPSVSGLAEHVEALLTASVNPREPGDPKREEIEI